VGIEFISPPDVIYDLQYNCGTFGNSESS
jgi:hypothetical protein